jgi:hypothetical protein
MCPCKSYKSRLIYNIRLCYSIYDVKQICGNEKRGRQHIKQTHFNFDIYVYLDNV